MTEEDTPEWYLGRVALSRATPITATLSRVALSILTLSRVTFSKVPNSKVRLDRTALRSTKQGIMLDILGSIDLSL